MIKVSRTGIITRNDKNDRLGKRTKQSTFIPEDERKYRSLKIMFHKCINKYILPMRIREHFARCYNGAGFLMVDLKKQKLRKKKYNIYDINSAYQYTLVNDIYPLSSELEFINNLNNVNYKDFMKKYKKNKYIIQASFKGLTPKFKDKEYNIFKKQMNMKFSKDGGVEYFNWFCDVDLNNLIKLYDFEKVTLYKAYIFKESGLLGNRVKAFIDEQFKKLSEFKRDDPKRKEFKTALHIVTYGKNAQKVDGLNVRSLYIPIAIYQSAYTRQRMIDNFIKNIKYCAYIDTDSIFINYNHKFNEKIGEELGDFKCEYHNCKVDICRSKGYVIYDDKDNIIKQKWSGIKTQLTKKQIDDIMNGKDITITETRKDNKIKIKIQNKMMNGYKIKV